MSQGYTYNAIAEHPIIPEFDDNEIKYKWNGALLNLSDLPVSDYTKTIYNIAGSVTSETEVVTNTLSVSLENTGDTYELVVNAQYAPEANITVRLTVEGESSPVEVVLNKGSLSARAATSVPSTAARPGLSNASVSPSKDDTYTYQVAIEQVITDKFKAYYGVCPRLKLNDVNDYVPSMSVELVSTDWVPLKFTLPLRDEEFPTDEDLMTVYNNILVIALPKEVFDGELYELHEQSTPGAPSGFVKYGDIVMDGAQYAVLCKVDDDDVVLVSSYSEEKVYQFNIKYKSE